MALPKPMPAPDKYPPLADPIKNTKFGELERLSNLVLRRTLISHAYRPHAENNISSIYIFPPKKLVGQLYFHEKIKK